MGEERDCESGLAHQGHIWSQGGKQYHCHGRTETVGLSKDPAEVIDAAIWDAMKHEANGIEVTMYVLDALDHAGYKIVRKWGTQ